MTNPSVDTVEIALDKAETRYVISDVQSLAEALLARWPERLRGRAHLRARKKCHAALEGKCKPIEARTAFIAACREAGISVFPDDAQRP
ncbi:MAG: DUF982 domain-containing protein [Rhizobiaceae bacterium]|nr:DUF982 domain-containing protein [Rhizobiaceae bacterium]